MEQLHCWIRGRVQGVWFRASTRNEGAQLGLTGWARNLADGRVEVVAQGERERLEAFLAWLHQGPPGARVDGVESHWEPVGEELAEFGVRT
ncbi:MAG: acylphosphatase [Nitrospirae bacterium CG18_big_fil_WC_8_21_14_2_50_70_55]|nr:acylphosphatase [Deltaproteobacteria bacterium]OIP63377.1 MAG: acylphosphatase [Nitrospirae bacterium CG2_30_70_394]PIQ05394.1 MAG: acylphosphatase [Nitrospirae bacterium CG18_big_fil_WC_8_21_14_2_50_70_55]PIU80043.1 MAG: acylphosphatase [Nitrospirae bacterium CG06_land_8_20_14_3_00_70_43]PIW83515.1 MAG: acylphosphatase [Nitrospirae bacterium CG_4_8_14_3_um_filter_70_85]PIX84302.1 MAG: acylphosphatase [Nitrospirae bacterium CG_4_10_14_3_um_filter_70_108]PJB96480.1 MAG: acylphosphatase [Nit